MTDLPSIIARSRLFGEAACSGVQVSPDGRWLAWIAPLDGVANVWIAPLAELHRARALTADTHRGIRGYMWSEGSRHLFFGQDQDGDEIFQVHAVGIENGLIRNLAPSPGARAFVIAVSPRHPDEVVIAINDRETAWPDLWRVAIDGSSRELLCLNERFSGFVLDDEFIVQAASRVRNDGGFTLVRPQADGTWRDWMQFDPDDARGSGALGLDAAAKTLYLRDSRGRDTAALVAIDLATDKAIVLAEDPRADIGGTIPDRRTYCPLACFLTVERRETLVIDDAIAADLRNVQAANLGDWWITGRSRDDRWWTIAAGSDVRPNTFWLYDREDESITLLFEGRPQLCDATLAAMTSFTVSSRDGRPLVCYLTLPVGASLGSLPLVVSVHGGPWTRDVFGYSPEHQWLANRGYGVLSVNFRGSTGFGKNFLFAGDREWGARMDDDLDDAVDWVIERGIADPARLAIMGTSYGGYAVLSALTRQPKRYACGVDVVGPSNLESLLAATPPHWEAQRTMLHRAVGDPTTEDGRALLHDRSPLHRAHDIVVPLLIGQGARDPRVPQTEADQMVAAMRERDVPVDYILFPDEGHGFVRPANAIAFRIATEAFLARHIGGRFEPPRTPEYAGTSMKLDAGTWLRDCFVAL